MRFSLPPRLCSWYGSVTSLALQTASVVLEHHGKNIGGLNQWIRVKFTPRLSKNYLTPLEKSTELLAGDG